MHLSKKVLRWAGSRFWMAVVHHARKSLELLDSVVHRDELKVPPGNRLEALFGDRKGQHSIRVNDQYRICFKWTEAGPNEVELTDYH